MTVSESPSSGYLSSLSAQPPSRWLFPSLDPVPPRNSTPKTSAPLPILKFQAESLFDFQLLPHPAPVPQQHLLQPPSPPLPPSSQLSHSLPSPCKPAASAAHVFLANRGTGSGRGGGTSTPAKTWRGLRDCLPATHLKVEERRFPYSSKLRQRRVPGR